VASAMPDYGYVSAAAASPPVSRYQIILFVDRDHGCEQLAQSSYAAASRWETIPRPLDRHVRRRTRSAFTPRCLVGFNLSVSSLQLQLQRCQIYLRPKANI